MPSIEKTVLVLGAGASQEYGFPSGEGLIEDILTFLEMPNPEHRHKGKILLALLLQRFHELAYLTKLSLRGVPSLKDCFQIVEAFQTSLINSSPASIDDFLDKASVDNKDYEVLGKILIFLSISKYENAAESFMAYWNPPLQVSNYKSRIKRHDGWYSYFWKKLYENSKSPDELGQILKRITIVSFNYDRSIEHFLFTRIKNLFNLSDEATANIINENLLIHHVYGRLGLLPWQKPSLDYSMQNPYAPKNIDFILQHIKPLIPSLRSYHADLENELGGIKQRIMTLDPPRQVDIGSTLENIIHFASKIKTYTQAVAGNKEIETEASTNSRILFLGMGYHPQNLNWLNENLFRFNSKIVGYGTTFGLGKVKISNLISYLRGKIEINESVFHHPDLEIKDYVREVEDLIVTPQSLGKFS
jgi:hypothetical protein